MAPHSNHDLTDFACQPNYDTIKIVIIGGSYGGITAALNLLDLCNGQPLRSNPDYPIPTDIPKHIPIQITLIDERDGFYHLIGSPLAFADLEYAKKSWIKFQDIPALQNSRFRSIQGTVVNVNTKSKSILIRHIATDQLQEINYHYLIASSGLKRSAPACPISLSKEKFLQEVEDHLSNVKSSSSGVLIIGGGAVGIEMAAELKLVHPELDITLVHSRNQLLSSEPLPDEFKDSVLKILQSSNINLILGKRVAKIEKLDSKYKVLLNDQTILYPSFVITSTHPSLPNTSYLSPQLLDPYGFVQVDEKLRIKGLQYNEKNHFAIGDIVAHDGIKRCGTAMYMAYHASINLWATMLQECYGLKAKHLDWSFGAPVMGIALGKNVVCYDPENGVKFGEDLMEKTFSNDLSLKGCVDFLRFNELSEELAQN